jgi:hypothetical protein
MRLPAILALLALVLALAACSEGEGGAEGEPEDAGNGAETAATADTASGPSTEPVPEDETLTVGWILAGPADEGAVDAVEQAFSGRIESVVAADAGDPAAAATELAAQGARLVVSAIPGACAAIPDTHCAEPGDGWWNRAYLIGQAAGLVTGTDSVGYVAAGTTPEETAAVNSFALGCQSENPNCIVRLVVDPPNPARAVRRLTNQSADLVATTLADPALCDAAGDVAVQPVLAAGAMCGTAVVSTDLAAFAEPLVQAELDGSFEGAAELPLDAWGDQVAQEVRTKVEERAGEIDGGLNVFTGPLFDNEGEQQVGEGEELPPEFVQGEWTWLLGGVLTN